MQHSRMVQETKSADAEQLELQRAAQSIQEGMKKVWPCYLALSNAKGKHLLRFIYQVNIISKFRIFNRTHLSLLAVDSDC
jgi:hypothetical protein